MGPFILASLVSEEAIKKNESKLGSFKKHFHHDYSGATGRSVPGRFSPLQAAVLDSLRPELTQVWSAGGSVAPGAGPGLRMCDSPMSGNSLGGPGQVSSQVQPGLGVQVEGRRSRPTSRLAQPPPHIIFNSPNLDQDLPGPFVTWPRGRQVRSALGGDDRALETLWEADASLGQSHKGSRPARW